MLLAFKSAVKSMPPTDRVWMVSPNDGTVTPIVSNSSTSKIVLFFKGPPFMTVTIGAISWPMTVDLQISDLA